MPPSQDKEKWTTVKIGKLLANDCIKAASESFEEISFLQSSFPDTNKSILFKEWIFFNMFAMFQGILAYFEEEQVGFRILDQFHHCCNEIFVEKGLFDKASTLNGVPLNRYNIYTNALKKDEKPGPIWWLAKNFCQICSEKKGIDCATIYGISYYWTETAIGNKTFISELLESIRIVD